MSSRVERENCRETGAVYFGENVQDIEDGEVVSSGGKWQAGVGASMASSSTTAPS